MSDSRHFAVANAEDRQRLDKVLALYCPDISRQRLQHLIKDGHVLLQSTPCRDPAHKVRAGAQLTLHVPEADNSPVAAQAIPLAVVFEDDHLLVIDKPAGLVVHPAAGNPDQTLVNALLHHCGASLSGIGGVRRPGIVHRLDKDTSGLMVIAKSDAVHQALSRQFQTRTLTRAYTALVWGVMLPSTTTYDAPIGRHPQQRKKMAVVASGKPAITLVAVQQRFGLTTLVHCQLATGRTHQIRVHLSHHGFPLIGDPLYARRLPRHAPEALRTFSRQALHAHHLGFTHPISKDFLAFDSVLPSDFQTLVNSLE